MIGMTQTRPAGRDQLVHWCMARLEPRSFCVSVYHVTHGLMPASCLLVQAAAMWQSVMCHLWWPGREAAAAARRRGVLPV